MLCNWTTLNNLLCNIRYNGLNSSYVLYNMLQDVYKKSGFQRTDCITAIRPFILIQQFQNKSVQETNKYLPLLLGCKLQVKHHTYPAMSVVFPEPSPPVLFNDSMKQLIGAVVLYLQVIIAHILSVLQRLAFLSILCVNVLLS